MLFIQSIKIHQQVLKSETMYHSLRQILDHLRTIIIPFHIIHQLPMPFLPQPYTKIMEFLTSHLVVQISKYMYNQGNSSKLSMVPF